LSKFGLFNAIENILKIIQLNGSQSPSPPFFLWSLNNNNNNNNDNFKGEESNYLNKLSLHNQQFEKPNQYKLQSLTLRFLKNSQMI